MAKKKKTVRVTGGTFNLLNSRNPQVVRSEVVRLVQKHEPLFLNVQEAVQYYDVLQNIPGYEYHASRAYPGGKECGILVQKSAKVTDRKFTSEGDGWVTVLGNQHAASTFARVTIDGWLRVASVHAPTPTVWVNGELEGPGERVDDYLALLRGVKDFLSVSEQVRVAAGDWNEPPSTMGRWAPGWVADQTGARVQAPDALLGHGRIDYPMVKNGRIVRVWKDLEISEASDHEPVLFVIEATIDTDEDEEPPKNGGGGHGGQGSPNQPPYDPDPEGPPGDNPPARSGRGRATLGGKPFRLNPTSVNWTFSAKIADIATVGGKVVQVLGTRVSDLKVSGTFGAGGWREQAKFLDWIKELADRNTKGRVVRFRYPAYGWDIPVIIKAYTTPDGGRSIVLDNDIIAPRWDLTLFIVEGSASLDKIAKDAFIARLSRGLGWKQTKFNGPTGLHSLNEVLGMSVEEYLEQQYGIGSVQTGNEDFEATPEIVGPLPPGGTPSKNKQLGQSLAARMYEWYGEQWTALDKLWTRESGWNHLAENPSSGAYGIPQSLPGNKMASVGDDWRTNPVTQIKWGLRYIKERYGTPVAAWAHSEDVGWY